MIGVIALDVGPGFGDVVAVGVGVVFINIAAEDGFVGCPVAIVTAALRASKAAVDCHAVFQGEGGGAVAGGAGVIHALSYPDFGTIDVSQR